MRQSSVVWVLLFIFFLIVAMVSGPQPAQATSLPGHLAPLARPFVSGLVPPSPNVESLIKAIESRYNRAHTLSLHFEETFQQGRPHRPESGTLTLRKPGRMRWDYDAPPGKVFVSDGKMAYLYTPQDHRVERSSLKMSEDMRAPMAFLLGRLDMKREFRSFEIRPGEGGVWLDALAKTDRAPYEKIELLVAPDSSIRRLTVRGRDQSVLAFVFSGESLNPPVNDGVFRFTIPAGTEVVDSVTTEQEN